MPRSGRTTVQNNFIRGWITEATGMNFPEDASSDTDNCRFDRIGRTKRRLGIDVETPINENDLVTTLSATAGVIREYIWKPVGDDGDRSFLVVQYGDKLAFFEPDSSGNYTSGLKSFSVDLLTYKVGSADITQEACSFATGNGELFVANPNMNPISVEYDSDTDGITVTEITVEIRDLELLDDGLEINERPTTLTDIHRYNLSNASWNEDVTIEGDRGGVDTALNIWRFPRGAGSPYLRNDYPGNHDAWWYYKAPDGSEVMDTRMVVRIDPGNSPAPRGHWIYNAFDVNRDAKTGYSGVPAESTSERPSQIAFYAGRVWYAGVEDDDYGNRVYFSQLVKGTEDVGKCYSINDPASENLNDPLDTDGGVIKILDMGRVHRISNVLDSLLLFSSTGVWSISGGDGTGFSATDFSVKKLSSVESVSPYSFTEIDGLPIWWNYNAIYMIQSNEQNTGLVVRNITDDTIRTGFQAILNDSKFYAKGAFDPLSRELQWVYRSTAASTFNDNFMYDRILVLDTVSGAFYPWSVDTTDHTICGIFTGEDEIGAVGTEVVTDNLGATVTDSADADVTVDIVTPTRTNTTGTRFKYTTCAGASNVPAIDDEVADGEYDFSSISNSDILAHDFRATARRFYAIEENTGPTKDQLVTYAMSDHSELARVDIEWEGSVLGMESDCEAFYYDSTNDLFFIEVDLDPTGRGFACIDSSGVLKDTISSSAHTGVWFHRFDTGDPFLVMLKFLGLFDFKFSIIRYDVGTESFQTEYDTTALGTSFGNAFYAGAETTRTDSGTARLFYWHENNLEFRSVLIDDADSTPVQGPWITAAQVAAAGFTSSEIAYVFYLNDLEGDIYIKEIGANNHSRYSFWDQLFTNKWDVTHTLNTSNNGPTPSAVNIVSERLGFFTPFASGVYEVIDLSTGIESCSLAITPFAAAGIGSKYWDDISGSGWSVQRDGENRRFQTSCGILLTTGTNATFSEERRTDYTDWVDASAASGFDFDSYFTTGALVHNEGIKDFQSNYVAVFSETESNSSCIMNGRFDWSNDGNSGEYSTPQEVYSTKRSNRDVQRKRLKVRGSGPALNLHFKSAAGKPFNIIGWSILETGENRP